MGRLVDSVGYHFSFSCLTNNPNNPKLVEQFKKLLVPIMPSIKFWLANGKDYSLQLAINDIFTKTGEDFEKSTMDFVDYLISESEDPARLLRRPEGVWHRARKEWPIHAIQHLEITGERHALPKDYTIPAKKIHIPPHEVDMYTSVEDMCCPSEDLSNAYIPLKEFFDIPLEVCYSRQKIDLQMADASPSYQHNIYFRIPRFCFLGEPFPFQDLWVSTLKYLCDTFDMSAGGIHKDYISANTWPIPPFWDNYSESLMQKLYTPGNIPGFCWFMCLSKKKVNASLEELFGKTSHAFADANRLSHGGCYFQLSPSIEILSRETNDTLHELLKTVLWENFYSRFSYRLSTSKAQDVLNKARTPRVPLRTPDF